MSVTPRTLIWRVIIADIALLIMAFDQLTKWLVTHHVFGQYSAHFLTWLTTKAERFSAPSQEVTSFLNIAMVWNEGISFGMLQTGHDIMPVVLSVIAVLVSIGFIVWAWQDTRPIVAVTTGLVVGGAIGNVLDRLRFGAVIDFIDFHYAGWHYPAFNVADASIFIGVVLLLIDALFLAPKKDSEVLA